MSMKRGRLVWSRQHRGDGSWCAESCVGDETLFYVACHIDQKAGWKVECVSLRDGEEIDLGWHRYLREAKRAADIHHHHSIQAQSGDSAAKTYIERFPIHE